MASCTTEFRRGSFASHVAINVLGSSLSQCTNILASFPHNMILWSFNTYACKILIANIETDFVW